MPVCRRRHAGNVGASCGGRGGHWPLTALPSFARRLDALLFGYEVVGWTYHIEDWVAQPATQLAERLLAQMQPGCIVLLHDRLANPRDPAAADRALLIDALTIVLDRLSTTYRFVTVPELMRAGKPVRVPWFRPAQ